jgi:hypothetical protein
MGKTAIARLEQKIIFDEVMLEDFGHVEDIEVVLLGEDQRVSHKLLHALLIVVLDKVVVGVGSIDLVVVRIVQYGGIQSVVRDEVSASISVVNDDPGVNNLLSWQEEVAAFIFSKLNMNGIIVLKVLVQAQSNLRHMSIGHD